jgi:hypothetical protein
MDSREALSFFLVLFGGGAILFVFGQAGAFGMYTYWHWGALSAALGALCGLAVAESLAGKTLFLHAFGTPVFAVLGIGDMRPFALVAAIWAGFALGYLLCVWAVYLIERARYYTDRMVFF